MYVCVCVLILHIKVVITTYQTLCADFPKDKKGKGKANDDVDSGEDDPKK